MRMVPRINGSRVTRTPGRAATVAALGLAASACGAAASTPSPASGASAPCSGVSGAHHAQVVVEHADGHTVDRCVGFGAARESATAVMGASGVHLATRQFSFGTAVCQVDGEPAQYDPACLVQGQPYWALFVWNGSSWTSPSTGVDGVSVGDHQALGWRYVPASETTPPNPPPPQRF